MYHLAMKIEVYLKFVSLSFVLLVTCINKLDDAAAAILQIFCKQSLQINLPKLAAVTDQITGE